MSDSVVVTATSARTALGEDLKQTREQLERGRSALAAPSHCGTATAARCARIWSEEEQSEDDPALRILGHHGRLLDQLACAVHAQAQLATLPRERVGLFVALPVVDTPPTEFGSALRASQAPSGGVDLHAFFAGAWRAIHPLWPLSALSNVAAGQISIDLDLRGDNAVLAAEADAGLQALLEGAQALRLDTADAVLVGGVSGRVDGAAWLRWHLADALDITGRGVQPGEGGAMLALERASQALAREAPILARVLAVATAFGPDQGPGPTQAAIEQALATALHESGLAPAAVTWVYLGAQGTPVPDDAEGRAVARLLPDAKVVRTKPQLGHLGPGAAMLDVALAVGRLAGDPAQTAVVLSHGTSGSTAALVLGGR